MSSAPSSDGLLIERIRQRDEDAWQEFIMRFEGRLLAFVESRLANRSAAEDVVQETLVGFLTSLPNYDASRPLESYLFSIAAHKLTDHLRQQGRRPAVPLSAGDDSRGTWEIAGSARRASSIARSHERQFLEAAALETVLVEQLEHLRGRSDWRKIACLELLLVRGWANKDVAATLELSEQQVANYKFDFLAKLRTGVRRQGLSEDVFPELYDKESS